MSQEDVEEDIENLLDDLSEYDDLEQMLDDLDDDEVEGEFDEEGALDGVFDDFDE